MSEKITILPYAGPKQMGYSWDNTIKSHKAGKKINGKFVSIYNPAGEAGAQKKEKNNEKINL